MSQQKLLHQMQVVSLNGEWELTSEDVFAE